MKRIIHKHNVVNAFFGKLKNTFLFFLQQKCFELLFQSHYVSVAWLFKEKPNHT